MATIINFLRSYKNLKNLDISGNRLSSEAASYLEKLLSYTNSLKVLNISSCLYLFESSRKIFKALTSNTTLEYLNLSGNLLNNKDYEFGSRIGRLIQLHKTLIHLDIRHCHLIQEELLFITKCISQNDCNLMSVHMVFNQISKVGRILARIILNAKVKYPFKAQIQIHEKIKNLEDKNLLLILNAYVISSTPSDNIDKFFGNQEMNRPIHSVSDIIQRLQFIK